MKAQKSLFITIGIFLFALFLLTAPLSSDPFPIGHSMMSQGALIETEGASGRQPWTPAAHYRDTLRWGASAAAVSYHGGGSAARYAAGGFMTAGPVVGKLSLAQLDVMGLYYEQTASLSAGSRWRYLSFSLDANVNRAGLTGRASTATGQGQVPASHASAALGATVLAQTSRVSADITVEGLTVLTSGDPAADPAPSITARACTAGSRYGSQGAMILITPRDASPVRFVLAQEYRIGKMFALSASIASNPTMIGFGLTVDKSPITGTAAVVNHPFLGWSKGMSAGFAR